MNRRFQGQNSGKKGAIPASGKIFVVFLARRANKRRSLFRAGNSRRDSASANPRAIDSHQHRTNIMTERTIFLAALELADEQERAAYVERACGEDAALRAEVEALLTTHEQSGGFLETPAVPPLDSEVSPTLVGTDVPPDHKPGKDQASAESQLRRYLQPSTRPGWLGRLGHYEVEMILGRGAFGVVAKAFDEKLHRVVAIKMMHPELAATSPPRQRFIREARTAAAVQHENIVGIYAVEEEPIPYLVMEYVPGDSLQQRLDRIGPLLVPEVLRIGRQLAAGLAAAHAAHLIHRDIKPSNILLTGGLDERAKITDFGLARAVDDASLTQSGLIAGTPMYMAPEQARGETLDHRADLFSLGSVLYQLVSGRPPFRAGSTVAVLKRVCDDTPRPITDVIPGTPEWLQTIIFRLLEKDRNHRFQTASEVANLLEQCQTELRVKGFVQSVPELLPKLRETTEIDALPTTETSINPAGENARSRKIRAALLRWLVLPLAMLAALPYFGQRLARWFDTPIPALPQTELTAGLRFDGRDDYVEVTGLDWDYPQFTIEALVTSSNASGQGTIAQLSGGSAKAIEFMALYDGPQADPGKRISGARIQGKTPYVNAYGPFAGDVRQHRALVFDGRYLNYYINGVWQGQRFAEPHEGLQWRMTALHIGCDGELRSRFQGVIDQVRISRVARYSQNFPPVTSLSSDDKTLAMYDFSEGSGDTLRDVSGSGHDGKIVGAEWVRRRIEPRPAGPDNPLPSATPKPANAPFDAARAKQHQDEWAAYLQIPVEYENSVGMKFRLIPPGEFLMGAPENDADAQPYEKPQHKVTLTQAYYMGTTEVTVGQFRRFVDATKYVTEAESDGEGAFDLNPRVRRSANVWNNKSDRSDVDGFPVRCVGWQDAHRFCEWLSQSEGRAARLPTEAEWEFACRGGTHTRYSFGDNVSDTENPPRGRGAPFSIVGKGPANPFGLHEMHGNVHEICLDSGRTYTADAVTDPIGSLDVGTCAVVRSGAASGDVSRMRSSHRYLNDQRQFPGINFATAVKGFRVVLGASLVESAPKSMPPQ
jgi:serine/threonine protein kinase/formylglycine-generating enzyme required for sulfatase activity